MKTQWLRCRVTKGMFSDEMAVTYDRAGHYMSVFVPKSEVTLDPDGGETGRVRVNVVERDGNIWASLPTEYRDPVLVRMEDLADV